MTLLGGAWIFLAFLVLMVIVLVFSTYTRKGNGINMRSYSRRYGDAPGAEAPNRIGGRDGAGNNWSRGTR
jgi:hypothetical protein